MQHIGGCGVPALLVPYWPRHFYFADANLAGLCAALMLLLLSGVAWIVANVEIDSPTKIMFNVKMHVSAQKCSPCSSG